MLVVRTRPISWPILFTLRQTVEILDTASATSVCYLVSPLFPCLPTITQLGAARSCTIQICLSSLQYFPEFSIYLSWTTKKLQLFACVRMMPGAIIPLLPPLAVTSVGRANWNVTVQGHAAVDVSNRIMNVSTPTLDNLIEPEIEDKQKSWRPNLVSCGCI